jgi:N-methylhydantoinase B
VLKLVQSGTPNQLILDILAGNVRLREQVLGDISAQITALGVMERRLIEMLSEYRLSDLREISQAIFTASRTAALEELRRIPSGVYFGTAEGDGWDEPVKIAARISITESEVSVDYTGSSAQSRYGINESYNHTYAYTIYPLKCMICPTIPNNEGFTRLFRVHAPEGSIVNCKFPAAVGARQLVGHLLQAAIFEALAPVLPDRVQADSGTPLWTILLRGVDPARDRAFSTILFFNGGMGAMRDRDGISATSFPANISNTPLEVVENLAPVLFRSKRLDEDSGGAGARAGGLGQIVSLESRWPGTIRTSLLTERVRVAPRGLLGGSPGKPGHVFRNGAPVENPKGVLALNQGDVLELGLPGGGGFGKA